MATLSLLGLAKCSTCQKAVEGLRAAGHEVSLRDVAAEPLSEAERQALLDRFGDRLVNRASLTWRGMDEAARAEPPMAQLAARPALMKRPVILDGQEGGWLGWTANVKRALGAET